MLINNNKTDYSGIVPVLQITHHGIFNTDTVAIVAMQVDRLKAIRLKAIRLKTVRGLASCATRPSAFSLST